MQFFDKIFNFGTLMGVPIRIILSTLAALESEKVVAVLAVADVLQNMTGVLFAVFFVENDLLGILLHILYNYLHIIM